MSVNNFNRDLLSDFKCDFKRIEKKARLQNGWKDSEYTLFLQNFVVIPCSIKVKYTLGVECN